MLAGERIKLRPIEEDDLERVRAINAEPSVGRWSPPGEFDEFNPERASDAA